VKDQRIVGRQYIWLLRWAVCGVKADSASKVATAGVDVLSSSIRKACQVVAFALSCAGLCADDEGCRKQRLHEALANMESKVPRLSIARMRRDTYKPARLDGP